MLLVGLFLLAIGNIWIHLYTTSPQIVYFLFVLVIFGSGMILYIINKNRIINENRDFDWASIFSVFGFILILWTTTHGFLVFLYLFFRYANMSTIAYYLGTTLLLLSLTYRIKFESDLKHRISYLLNLLPFFWALTSFVMQHRLISFFKEHSQFLEVYTLLPALLIFINLLSYMVFRISKEPSN